MERLGRQKRYKIIVLIELTSTNRVSHQSPHPGALIGSVSFLLCVRIAAVLFRPWSYDDTDTPTTAFGAAKLRHRPTFEVLVFMFCQQFHCSKEAE